MSPDIVPCEVLLIAPVSRSFLWFFYEMEMLTMYHWDICKLRLIPHLDSCFLWEMMFMSSLVFVFLMVIALTAVWAKGDDFLWVFASSQVRATLYQHILIKNYWKYTKLMLRGFSGNVLTQALIVCACVVVQRNCSCAYTCDSLIKAQRKPLLISHRGVCI